MHSSHAQQPCTHWAAAHPGLRSPWQRQKSSTAAAAAAAAAAHFSRMNRRSWRVAAGSRSFSPSATATHSAAAAAAAAGGASQLDWSVLLLYQYWLGGTAPAAVGPSVGSRCLISGRGRTHDDSSAASL